MRIYLDTSALAKKYVSENGSNRVLEKMRRSEEVVCSVLVIPEIVSALNRLKRERRLSEPHYEGIKRNLSEDILQFSMIDLNPEIVQRSIHCLEITSLKTLDAIHVASAKESACDIFLTADHKQGKAAGVLGLSVEVI